MLTAKQIQNLLTRSLSDFLSSRTGIDVSPELLRIRFLKLTYFQVGLIIVISNVLEIVARDQFLWRALPTIISGIVYILAPIYLDYIPNQERFTQINIILGIPLVIQRALTTEGIDSPSSMWFLLFPLFAQAFSTLRFTILTIIFCELAVVGVAAAQNFDLFQFSVLHGTTPYWINIVVAITALYFIAHFGFYANIVEMRLETLQKTQLEQETEASVNAVLRDLSRSVVYQVRTPLATLSLSAELLESKVGTGPGFELLNDCKNRISRILDALLFITEPTEGDTYEVTQVEQVVQRAFEAFRATTHIPSFQYELNSSQSDIAFRLAPIRMAKTLWRIARILEPALVASKTPTLTCYMGKSPWGTELRLEVVGLPKHFISNALLTDIENQATRARASILADGGTVSVMSPTPDTLLVLLILAESMENTRQAKQ